MDYFSNELYEQETFDRRSMPQGEYEGCTFRSCEFSNTVLNGYKFIDCIFISCNLSMATLVQTVLHKVKFESCKLLGLHFESCSPIGMTLAFEQCIMDHTSFYKTKLPQTNFISCSLAEADFTGADFKGSVFQDCDLRMAHFEQTNLEKADLSSSINISLDPNKNQLKNAVFSMHNLPGLLAVYKIKIR